MSFYRILLVISVIVVIFALISNMALLALLGIATGIFSIVMLNKSNTKLSKMFK